MTELGIRAGYCRRVAGTWFAEVCVGNGRWRATAKARGSGPGIAVRRAVDAAVEALRKRPSPPGDHDAFDIATGRLRPRLEPECPEKPDA